jgi:hypothetical protein
MKELYFRLTPVLAPIALIVQILAGLVVIAANAPQAEASITRYKPIVQNRIVYWIDHLDKKSY